MSAYSDYRRIAATHNRLSLHIISYKTPGMTVAPARGMTVHHPSATRASIDPKMVNCRLLSFIPLRAEKSQKALFGCKRLYLREKLKKAFSHRYPAGTGLRRLVTWCQRFYAGFRPKSVQIGRFFNSLKLLKVVCPLPRGGYPLCVDIMGNDRMSIFFGMVGLDLGGPGRLRFFLLSP